MTLISNIRKAVVLILFSAFVLTALVSCGKKESAEALPEKEETVETAEESSMQEAVAADTEPSAEPEDSKEPENRDLTKDELKKIEEDFNDVEYNGFIVSEFETPEDIYWDEALYNGGGIDVSSIDEKEIEDAFMKENGWDELYTSLTYLPTEEVERFVEKTTGKSYSSMKHPLNWTEIGDKGVVAFAHGDTNFRPVKLLSGKKEGDKLTIDYVFEGYGDEEEDTLYRLVMREGEDGYIFESNLWNPPGGREAAVKEIYEEIIQKYAKAVSEGWDMEKLEENNMSYLCGLFANTRGDDFDPMEKLGYYYQDIDGDGTDELFIGADSGEDYIETIFEVFSVKDGSWIRIFSAGERDEYYLAKDGTFYNQASDSASNYVLIHYRAEGPYKFLTPIDGIIYDLDFEDRSKEPWYYSKDNFWDTNEAEHISEKEYSDYEKKAEESYVRIDYEPFSSVEIVNAAGEGEVSGEEGSAKTHTDEELCEAALDFYERETGYRPGAAAVDSTDGDMVTIQLYDNMGDHNSTSAWYEVNRETGKGQEIVMGTEVSLF